MPRYQSSIALTPWYCIEEAFTSHYTRESALAVCSSVGSWTVILVHISQHKTGGPLRYHAGYRSPVFAEGFRQMCPIHLTNGVQLLFPGVVAEMMTGSRSVLWKFPRESGGGKATYAEGVESTRSMDRICLARKSTVAAGAIEHNHAGRRVDNTSLWLLPFDGFAS